jgi:predicted ATPase/DNA-binding SARP family transcriptional activator/DNA-binding CsgD family transcriptional regulator
MQPESDTRGQAEERGAAPAVRVRLLGGLGLSVGQREVSREAWSLRKAGSLVKLLSLAPSHALHREQVTEALWPNLGRRAASNNLRQALHAARVALHPEPDVASRLLASAGERVVLCPAAELWVDAEAFEEAAKVARRAEEPLAYEAALDLYAGELLPEDRYEGWAEGPRAHLRGLYLSLLSELALLYEEQGDLGRAETVLGRLIVGEPTHEGAHGSLMRLYALEGRRAEALSQYGRMEQALSRTLGVEPSASARALREEISSGRYPQPDTSREPRPEGAGAPPNNLPLPRASFVGRERDMVEVKRDLALTRLLTLTGAGGSGKTRLALEVARDITSFYPDGAWFVDLAALSEPGLVPQAVAATLDIREQPGRPLTDTLLEALSGKDILLVLDNCEHLVESVARLVVVLLARCRGLRMLATSREPLGVEGEVLRRVPPLSVPLTSTTSAEISGYGAVRLFVERTRLRLPAFGITQENGYAVCEVCRRLEGVPLAVELAAARMGTMAAEQLARRLDDSLAVLSSGSRTAPPRHKTMRATLEWSHGLLSEKEQAAFRRLSPFAGGFTLEATEAVLAAEGIEEVEVLEMLSALVEKSLIVAKVVSGRSVRYRMLEPIRQYAQEKLQESAEEESTRRRHAEYFLGLAQEADPELLGEQQEEWFRLLEREHANFRAALGWAFSREEAKLGLRLAVALYEFWDVHGHIGEGRGWLEKGISASGSTTESTRARALNDAGWMAWFQGDFESARALVEESVSLYRQLGEKEGLAWAIANLGYLSVLGHRGPQYVPALVEESMRLRSEIRDRRTIAYLLLFEGLAVGSVLFGEGSSAPDVEDLAARFRDLHERSLALFRNVGDRRGAGNCLINLGLGELILGDDERATAQMRELLHLGRSVDNKWHIQYAFFGLAGIAASRGHPVRAARLWAASEGVREAAAIELPPLGRAATNYEGRLAEVRAELGEEAFDTAWEEGRAMPADEAARYALSEEGPTPSPGNKTADEAGLGEPTDALTHREREIAELVACGLTNRRIASELCISERTVATHVGRIFKKLRVHSRERIRDLPSERA